MTPARLSCPVEVGAADMDAAVGQHVAAPVGGFGALRGKADDGEVRGAAADVGDQHDFFALDLRFVMVGRGNRLELEADVLEADGVGDFAQGVFGELVGDGVVIDKKDRAAENGLLEAAPGFAFGPRFQGADEFLEQVAEDDGAAVNFGAAVDQAAAEQAFQGAHQAAFGTGQVFAQAVAADADGVGFGIEEDDRGQRRLAVFQRQQRRLAGAQPADGGVGGAEIDAAGAGG
jgi:hypothetical protein